MARLDSLVGHCLARAAVARHESAGGSANWAAIKATPKAARVAGFITDWATLLHARGDEPLPATTVEVMTLYMETFGVPQRTAYRYLHEFRELWPEHSTPEPIARVLAAAADRSSLEASGPLTTVAL